MSLQPRSFLSRAMIADGSISGPFEFSIIWQPVSCSRTMMFDRVSPAIRTKSQLTPPPTSRASSSSPRNPPMNPRAVLGVPSAVRTFETSIPLPPGNRCSSMMRFATSQVRPST